MHERNKKPLFIVCAFITVAIAIGVFAFRGKNSGNATTNTATSSDVPSSEEKALFEQTQDKDFSKRLLALRNISMKASSAREKFLTEFSKNKSVSDLEKITAMVSLFKIAANPELKSTQIDELLNIEKTTKSDLIKTQVMVQMIYILPADSRTHELVEKIVKARAPKEAVPIAERFLKSQQKQKQK